MPQPEPYVYASGSPWKFGGLTKKQFAMRAWHELIADDALGRAAQLAYYFLFSLFPLGIFLSALIGAFAGTHSLLSVRLTREILHFVPPSASQLVRGDNPSLAGRNRNRKTGVQHRRGALLGILGNGGDDGYLEYGF